MTTLIRMTPLQRIISFLPWFIVFEAISMAVGYFASPNADNVQIHDWYRALVKSPFNPPSFVFPLAWTILYALIAYALWRVWTLTRPRPVYYFLFALGHMLLNWSWSYVFFAGQDIMLGFTWLLAILLSAIALHIWTLRYDRRAFYVLVPYILWLVFAAYLNFYIVWAN